MTALLDAAGAAALDATDPLAFARERFALPEGMIYLDGNSLGALPKATPARVAATVGQEWGRGLIASWNEAGWIDAPARLGARIAPLIGAAADEVIVADTTSTNLFKLLVAACRARPGRGTILTEPGNFPTDLYIAQGVAALLPHVTVRTVAADAIADAVDGDTAVVLLTHVHYRTGRMLDMGAITRAVQARGALMLWDLSHSTGAVAVDLSGCGVDLAVGCGYKYLNGGPGAPAFLYVASRLQNELDNPLSGWMGHGAPFAFGDDYAPAPGIARFLCGTPPIVAMAALEAGLDTFDGVGMPAVVTKSQGLIDRFVELVEARCPDLTLISPREAASRGSHVSFAHEDAYALCRALIARGVVGDFRAPDAVRFGFTPLYTSYEDVRRAAEILAEVIATRAWDRAAYRVRAAVT